MKVHYKEPQKKFRAACWGLSSTQHHCAGSVWSVQYENLCADRQETKMLYWTLSQEQMENRGTSSEQSSHKSFEYQTQEMWVSKQTVRTTQTCNIWGSHNGVAEDSGPRIVTLGSPCVAQNCRWRHISPSKHQAKLSQCHKVTTQTWLLSNTLQKPHISHAYTDSYSLKNNSRAHSSSWLVSSFSSWLVSCIQFMTGIFIHSVHIWYLHFIQFMTGIFIHSVHDWYLHSFSSCLVSSFIQFMTRIFIHFMTGIFIQSVHDCNLHSVHDSKLDYMTLIFQFHIRFTSPDISTR
jgi:hypothetical protein